MTKKELRLAGHAHFDSILRYRHVIGSLADSKSSNKHFRRIVPKMWISNNSNWKRIWGQFIGILLFCSTSSVQETLTQFGLPPCCYVEPVHYPTEPREVELDIHYSPSLRYAADASDSSVSNANIDEAFNETEGAESKKIRTFLFPMDAISSGVKAKRTTNETVGVVITSNATADAELEQKSGDAGSEHLEIRPIDTRSESDLDVHSNVTLRHLPSDWKKKLRRVLYQSIKGQLDLDERPNNKSEIIWSKIYEAPLQVIAANTRQEIDTDDALASLEYISVPNERISGVMVNTETGIELRTSESVDSGVSSAHQHLSSSPCDCHLIHHGDTLLAYWSIGFSGNNLEYLIYPLPHNVPTPPIFESFHTDPIIRPSPIDLNPLIMSRSNINEVSFQPSLEFGHAAATEQATYANQEKGIRQSGRSFPPMQFGQGFGIGNEQPYGFGNQNLFGNNLPPIGNAFPNGNQQAYPIGTAFPNGNQQAFPIDNGYPFWNGLAPYPHINYPQQVNFPEQQSQPDRFQGYPPRVPPIMYMPPLPPLPIRKNGRDVFQNQFPRGPNLEQGNVFGPLDPFNSNHPKSIQEILFGNLNGNYFPRPLDAPPVMPNDGFDGELPPGPGPNPGLYPIDFDRYPRHPPPGQNIPPRDEVVRSKPPGIYVKDTGRRPTERGQHAEKYNYNGRGSSERSVILQEPDKNDCYITGDDCLRRYGEDLRDNTNWSKFPSYLESSGYDKKSKTKKRDRGGRRIKSPKITEASYVLDF